MWIFEHIVAAGVKPGNAQEKSELRDLLLRMRGQMLCVIDAAPAGFPAGLGSKDFLGRPVLLRAVGLFGAQVGGPSRAAANATTIIESAAKSLLNMFAISRLFSFRSRALVTANSRLDRQSPSQNRRKCYSKSKCEWPKNPISLNLEQRRDLAPESAIARRTPSTAGDFSARR